MRHVVICGLMILALAGCAGGSVYNNYTSSQFTSADVVFAQADGPNRAVILGNPFADDAANAAVLAHMQARNPQNPLSFTLAPRPEATAGYKIVMIFGQLIEPQANACAEATPRFSPARAGRIEITAAFCRREYLLSSIQGAMPAVASARDPGLHDLIGEIMTGLSRSAAFGRSLSNN